MNDDQGSKIDTVEWIILIQIAVVFDVSQFVLDILGPVSLGFTELLAAVGDFIIGPAFLFYFWLRNVKLTWTRVGSLCGVFVGELIPALHSAPLWTLDILYIYLSVQAEKGGMLGTLAKASTFTLESASGPKPPIMNSSTAPALQTPGAQNSVKSTNQAAKPPRIPEQTVEGIPKIQYPDTTNTQSYNTNTATYIPNPQQNNTVQTTTSDQNKGKQKTTDEQTSNEVPTRIQGVKSAPKEAKPLSDTSTRRAAIAVEYQDAFNEVKRLEKIVMQHIDRKGELQTARARLREARRQMETISG